MSNPYINVYKNNPTAGAQDGTAISTDGTFTAPLTFTLNASQNESQIQKCAVRTESGYIANNVTISDEGDTDDRLKLCATENGTFTDSISVGSVSAANSIFYVKASSSDDENPQTDRSISLKINCVIAAV